MPAKPGVTRRDVAATLFCLVATRSIADDVAAPRQVLAPTGTLRIGVYPGSPTSQVRGKDGVVHGLSVELGQELARRLGVPSVLVEFPRVAEIVDAMVASQVDVTVTNASPERAERVAFTGPVLALDLGFLVPPGSPAAALADLDAGSRRIGVTQGGTSERRLSQVLPHATLVPVPSMKNAVEWLRDGALDAYATNKAVLFELSDALTGSRVLAGRWGLEHLALAYPKGRDAAASYLAAFVRDVTADGLLAGAVARAGLRGQAPAGL